MTTEDYGMSLRRSRAARIPAVHYRICPHLRAMERMLFGTPVDHPSRRALRAEAEHLDDVREERRRRMRASSGAA